MTSLTDGFCVPQTSASGLDYVKKIEATLCQQPQVAIRTEHVFHGGVYTRTIRVPAGVIITGALIKIPTTLTVSGRAMIIVGEAEEVQVEGFMVLPAAAGRKQVFWAKEETFISLSFMTLATTVAEAEAELTDEADMLKSRGGENVVIKSGG